MSESTTQLAQAEPAKTQTKPAAKEPSTGPMKFGTFGGVFTPCTLTILGVIMFLRLGQVVGNAGVIAGLGIVLVAKLITTLTALSLSAVATNTRVKGGGAYFLISRSLGVEFGGSIGIVFFLAQAVSVAMYLIGFTETFVAAFPGLGDFRTIATITNVVVFVCVFIGAGWTIKLQYGILAVLALALISFAVGAGMSWNPEHLSTNLDPGYMPGESLFTMFALFFPAATGIMAGANMSGDLRDPARSIPRGTLSAIGVTALVYVGMVVLLAASEPRRALIEDTMIISSVSWWSPLIIAGIFAATLSSAIGSMMGAPRILQAMGRDGIIPGMRFFGRGSGLSNEPRRATVLTFAIAQAAIMLGDLNALAPIITMFFMVTYGYLNLATFYESISRNPSYRPTFRFSHWTTALLGAVACGGVMFLVSPLWAGVATLSMIGLYRGIALRKMQSAWGDVRSGAAFESARRSLLRLEEDRYHPKNWRPSILLLSRNVASRLHLAVWGHWLTAGRGLLSLGTVVPGDGETQLRRRAGQEDILRRFIREQELDAFPAVIAAPDVTSGIEALVQCHGIGAFRPNLVLMRWSEDPERREEFCGNLRTVRTLGRSLALLRLADESGDAWIPPEGTIDVWWRGKENGALMVLLAHLLSLTNAWRGRRVRLLRMVASPAGVADSQKHLAELLTEARIDADALAVVGTDFRGVLAEHSGTAAVVFLGFRPPAEGEDERFVREAGALTRAHPAVLLVSSAGEAELVHE